MSEEELRRQESQGCGSTTRQEYWLELYREHHKVIRRYFARHVRRRHDVDDLTQTVFLNVIARGGTVQNPRAYLLVAARHQLSCYWQRRRRSVLLAHTVTGGEGTAGGIEPCGREGDPLRQLSERETRTTVHSLIDSLTPALSEALRLRYVQGLCLKMAAACAGCSCVALEKRLERARHLLLARWQRGGPAAG